MNHRPSFPPARKREQPHQTLSVGDPRSRADNPGRPRAKPPGDPGRSSPGQGKRERDDPPPSARGPRTGPVPLPATATDEPPTVRARHPGRPGPRGPQFLAKWLRWRTPPATRARFPSQSPRSRARISAQSQVKGEPWPGMMVKLAGSAWTRQGPSPRKFLSLPSNGNGPDFGHGSTGLLPAFGGQNLAPASSFVPQRLQLVFGLSGLPHSAQNLAPLVRAPQCGHKAAPSVTRSRSRVISCSATFSRICWAVA